MSKATVAQSDAQRYRLVRAGFIARGTSFNAWCQAAGAHRQNAAAALLGKPKKLAADAELRAFVEARFNRLTFEQIADDVAANFPPERQVRRSAIHDWWQRVYKRKKPDHPG